MKMTAEDYTKLNETVARSMGIVENGDGRDFYDREQAGAERRRWDAYWHGTQGMQAFRSHLSSYLNDDHIDTALRKIQSAASLCATEVRQ